MMTKRYLVWICLILLVVTSSCEKRNEIDNTGVVRTPYVMYIGGSLGSMFKTNDANYFDPLHYIDDVSIRQVITADSNILYLKGNCYVSDDDGRAFNVCNTDARPYYDEPLYQKYFIPHQMHYDASRKRVYLCVNGDLAQSDDLGKTFTSTGIGAAPTSVTELDDDNVFAIQDESNIFVNLGGISGWAPVPINTPFAGGSNYFLTSFGTTLVATDYEGMNGCFYSTNGGVDWTSYGGVANNGVKILFVNAVENAQGSMDLFLGRDGAGLYKLDVANGSFETSSIGIPSNAKIQYVVSKKIVFRTSVERFFYFCATDKGLYLSEQASAGADWRLVRDGEFSTLQ